jgi:hypothetical protein
LRRSIKHLTVSAVRAIHTEVLAAHGGARGIRNQALLESAIAAPQASMMGRSLISNPIEIAAAYLFYLCEITPSSTEINGPLSPPVWFFSRATICCRTRNCPPKSGKPLFSMSQTANWTVIRQPHVCGTYSSGSGNPGVANADLCSASVSVMRPQPTVAATGAARYGVATFLSKRDAYALYPLSFISSTGTKWKAAE